MIPLGLKSVNTSDTKPMTKFKCSGCNYESLRKESVLRHHNNKTKCSEGILYVVEVEYAIICEYCSKEFSTQISKLGHQKKCGSGNLTDKKLDSLKKMISKIVLEKDKEIEKLKKDKIKKSVHVYIPVDEEGISCDFYETKRIAAISKKMIKNVLENADIDDDNVDVVIKGSAGIPVYADISNNKYIELSSDGTCFYYDPASGQKKASDLKVEYAEYCKNDAAYKYAKKNYCKGCLHKMLTSKSSEITKKVFEADSDSE